MLIRSFLASFYVTTIFSFPPPSLFLLQLPLPLGLDCGALTSARPPLPPRPSAMASRIGLRMQVQHNLPPFSKQHAGVLLAIYITLYL